MMKKKDQEYFKYGIIENAKFWKRLGGKPYFANRKILDFGCGHGSLCIDIANSGAESITGIDIGEAIDFAKENLINNFDRLKDKVVFKKKDLLKDYFEEDFDIIVSKDTLEHTINLDKILEKFHKLLKTNGRVYLGFGPLYNAYNGDHGRTQLYFPWLHAFLPEKMIVDRYNKKNNKQIKKIEDLGLSKYSFNQYKKFFNDSKFEIEYVVTNKSDHPVSLIFNLLSRIKFLEEYFTYNIYCILKKI